jgi:hypothetical protein
MIISIISNVESTVSKSGLVANFATLHNSHSLCISIRSNGIVGNAFSSTTNRLAGFEPGLTYVYELDSSSITYIRDASSQTHVSAVMFLHQTLNPSFHAVD